MQMTTSQIQLFDHLKAEEAKTLAWVAEDPENRCAWYVAATEEEISNLAERGITSVEAYELDGLRNELWDAYKDAWGVRPRHLDMYNMSKAQVEAELESCSNQVDREREWNREARIERKLEKVRARKDDELAAKVEAQILADSPALNNSVLPANINVA